MKLLIDIGNTRIKWALAEGNRLSGTGAVSHCEASSAEITDWIARLPVRPSGAYACNVAGLTIFGHLRSALKDCWGLELESIVPARQCGVLQNGYLAAERLGADRWAALVAAWHHCQGPACIVDAGTALTLDLLAANGRHLGGYIVPGLNLMRRALDRDTSEIAARDSDGSSAVAMGGTYGIDTVSAVSLGTSRMSAAFIDRIVSDFSVGHRQPRLLLTGGDTPMLQPLLRCAAEIRPQLVLEGLDLLTDRRG